MKRHIRYLFVLVAALSLTGCIKSFLDKPSQGQMTEEDFLGDNNSASSLTNSIYATYRAGGAWEGIGLYIGDLASDNALKGSIITDLGGTNPELSVNQFQNLMALSGDSGFINWIWENAYTGIGRANTAIRTINSFEGLEARQKEILLAECYFNRAWFYFQLLKHFGKAPITPLDVITGAQMADLDIADSDDLYEYIVTDLENAVSGLPTKAEWADWFPTGWYGKAHKGSAQGLLAKVLLYRASDDRAHADEYYEDIVQLVKDMELSSDGYTLVNFATLFDKSGEYSAESVFEIGAVSLSTGGGSYGVWELLGVRGTPNWGWGGIGPSINLVKAYDDADIRKNYTIIYGQTNPYTGFEQTQSVIAGETIIGTTDCWPNRFSRKAWQPRPANENNANYGGNIRLMRWAEVLLIGAEAAYHTGDAKAQVWFDAVRTRAGLSTKTVTPEAVWDEKRLELAMERDRYFDLVRIDKLQEGYLKARMKAKFDDEIAGLAHMKEEGIATDATVIPIPTDADHVQSGKHWVLPIPSDQIKLMNKLTQNDNY